MEIILAVLAALIGGWVAHKAWLQYRPSEKALALKAGLRALDQLAKLQGTAPEDVAAIAAAQAHEAALLAAFKVKAATLS